MRAVTLLFPPRRFTFPPNSIQDVRVSKPMKQWGLALVAAVMLMGCAPVTVRPDGGPKVSSPPDYQESKNYFFWGLGGVHTIDVTAVCGDAGMEQFQSRFTLVDRLLGFSTLGIYLPKTARVWCRDGDAP